MVFGAPESFNYTNIDMFQNPRTTVLFGKSDFAVNAYGGVDIDPSTLAAANGFVFGTLYTYSSAQISQGWGSYNGQWLAGGDVNKDGVTDLIIGVQDSIQAEGHYAGVEVIFGQQGAEPSWPTTLQDPGHVLQFADTDNSAGSDAPVAFLGDVNGDGIGDFAVMRPDSRKAWVVFGKTDLADPYYGHDGMILSGDAGMQDGSLGFEIRFPDYSGTFGNELPTAMVGADVNNDGTNDILIAVASGDDDIKTLGHVIFGKSGLGGDGVIDLSTGPLAPPDGFSIQLENPQWTAYQVSLAVGDMNGDGYQDLIVGLPYNPYSSEYNGDNRGRVYVIFSPQP
jgi:hypothetical protein